MTIECDYLIAGAGASALAFADELLTRDPDATMVLVDRRHAPGGHWNDAYPFVTLHQPAANYGVESTELWNGRTDTEGTNAGMMSLSSGSGVVDYFHGIMRDRLIPSGRVRFIPLSEVTPERRIKSLITGEETSVTVRRRFVDATLFTNSVPKTHTRKYAVSEGVACEPPNELPRLAAAHGHFCIVGAGKTAMDACTFLLTMGVEQSRLTWIIPRDSWLWNRATTQLRGQDFERVFESVARRQEAMAEATSATDFAHRMEAAGTWMRLDPEIEPEMFHAATITEAELDLLRSIEAKVRKGRVTEIAPGRVVLTGGEITLPEDTLYVDCTASPVAPMAASPGPVFDGDTIRLQLIAFPLVTFSAALIAFIEAALPDDTARNQCAAPVPLPDGVEDYLQTFRTEMMNRYFWDQFEPIKEWRRASRLEGFARMIGELTPEDEDKKAIMRRIRDATLPAVNNVNKLLLAR